MRGNVVVTLITTRPATFAWYKCFSNGPSMLYDCEIGCFKNQSYYH